MKRHGEIHVSSARGLPQVAATLATKKYLILAVAFMAVSFFAFMTLVQIAPLSFAVPASLPSGNESLTSAVPSARQNASVSSASTRLHWGQRFIPGAATLS